MLKDDTNSWIENPDSIKDHVQNFFVNLFKNQEHSNGCNQVYYPHLILSREDNNRLCLPISDADIWESVKSINAYKAPGPDGI